MADADGIIEKARKEGRAVLTEMESKELLGSLGIPTTQMKLATSEEEAVALSREIGYPCVLKVSSPDITHKSDAGGVKVGLTSEEQVAAAYQVIMASCREKFPEADIEGVTVQNMAAPGLEVIIGMATDPQFGPVLMFGLGGVWVEVLKDVSFKMAPLTRADAANAIGELRAARLLDGFRGSQPVDRAALEDILLRVSEFVAKTPQVKEMDLNPIFAYPEGAIAVDARVILGERPSQERSAMPSHTSEQLAQIFNARSVAVVGASDREGTFGRLFVEGLRDLGCPGIYPVNPKRDEILGFKTYPDLVSIPDPVEVAVLLTPPEAVLGLVKQAVEKKLKGVVVFAAGFGELGAEGKELEREIGRVGREGGVRVIGPNCIGFYSPAAGLSTFPMVLMEKIPAVAGSVGGFSQSGSFTDQLVWFLARKGLNFSTMVSCGNECDLAAEDYLEYFGDDENTKTILAYMEGIKDGRRFFEVAREVAAKKPVIMWKGGMSEQGAKAAASHTGALAGSAAVWNALFQQTGIINVTCMEQVVDCALAFAFSPLPKGFRTAVLSAHGGTGVGTADNCLAVGLELPGFADETKGRLRQIMPEVGTSIGNPVDIGVASLMNQGLYGEAIRIIADDPNIDMILVNTSAIRACEEGIVEASKTITKPVAVSVFALPELVPAEYAYLAENGIAAYPDAKRAAYALSRLAGYAKFKAERAAAG